MEHGGESHQQIPAYKSVSASSNSSQKGLLGGKKSSQSSETRIQSIPCERLSENTVTHLSPRQCLVGSTITAKGQVSLLTLDGLGEIQFRVRRDTTQRSTSSSSSSDWWRTQKQSGDGVSIPHSVVINSPFPIKVSASFIKVEEADGSPSLRDKIDTQAQIESLLAQIETQSCHTSHSGPTALTAGLVALTIAIATQYWGTELMEAVITSQAVAAGSTTAAVVAGSTAAMGSLLGTLGATLLNTKGNISASLKQTIHPDSLKGALAVGLTTGLCYELIPSQEVLKSASKSATAAVPEATSYFFPHARQAALQVPIETGVHTSLGTKKMGDAFRGAALNGVAQTAHRGAANALGANASKLGTFGHKLGHLGAATTAAHISSKGKDFKTSLINGANAVLGEMIMEATVDRALEVEALKKAHPDLSPQELDQRFQDQTAHRKHLAIWTSGALGGICGGDVGTSASLAGTSIEHNFMSTSKELFLEDPEEETQAKESFWGRSASQGEKGASKKTSLFGAKEEKKAKAALSGASARPDTQREYAKALDPKGAVAKSIGKPYEMRNPVHVSFSEAFTPKWHSEVKASVQNFNRFLVETEPRRSLQRVERTGEDFKGKAQALSKEKLGERPRSNSASEREMAAYFWSLTEHQEGEVQAAEAAEIRHLEAEERVAQTAHAHEEATGWGRLRTASEWRDAEDIALLTGFDYSWTVPNKSLLEARRAFQERNKPLLATINQSIQKTETFHKQNPHCPMTPEERQDLFDLYETREFVATAHFHIPVNVKQGIGTGILIGTTFMPLGKFVAEGPRQVAKAFSETSKMIRAAEVHATRMLNLQKGKSALLKIPGMPFKKKEITSHFGSVVQELKAEFVQGTQKSATLEALNLETSQSPFVDKVTLFEQKYGKIAIQNMSTGEFAQSLANRADRKFLGNGPEVGKQKHRYAKEVGLRYQRMREDKRQLMFEKRFIENEEWKKNDGLKGSVVPDVYDPRTHEVFDYKFGKAHLGTRQITNTTAVMPKFKDNPLIMTEVKPTLKTEQTK